MALIFDFKRCKFGEKTCNNSRDIEFFLGDYFFWRALYMPYTSDASLPCACRRRAVELRCRHSHRTEWSSAWTWCRLPCVLRYRQPADSGRYRSARCLPADWHPTTRNTTTITGDVNKTPVSRLRPGPRTPVLSYSLRTANSWCDPYVQNVTYFIFQWYVRMITNVSLA